MIKPIDYFAKLGITHLKEFSTPEEAYQRILELYEAGCQQIKEAFNQAIKDPQNSASHPLKGNYPFLGMVVSPERMHIDARLSYGVVDNPGPYGTTLTRPDMFKDYYLEQMRLLHHHHEVPFYVGLSQIQMPLPFVIDHEVQEINPKSKSRMNFDFALPNLTYINDDIANCSLKLTPDEPYPLSLFTAKRVDFSLNRIYHYTNTAPKHFQNFILLTNYQRYIEAFRNLALEQLHKDSSYTAFVEPGDVVTPSPHHPLPDDLGSTPQHLPQMPAYHLKRADNSGITFINIGIGPTNAKNITDHLAVLRPDCWIMLGHCAGLRRSQQLGDYVLAHAYQREDDVMNHDLPRWVPIPPIAEVQVALQQAVANITGESGKNLKSRMRTGTLVTVNNRNWELRTKELFPIFKQSRAMALDMESATIAANGFRFRVPYGTLLCVSDKPIHGEIKLRGMANAFYRQRVQQHLLIGLETIRILREQGTDQLHSRKLRGFDEPPFK